ncbi:MAG: hypothetical protein H7175_13925 [Burkholderiales bacterium]|nr:hypothetical protein [Anaerolineae bacterium]
MVDPAIGINGSDILLAEFGAGLDERLRFAPGQWVEVSNEARLLYGQAGELVEVGEVNDRVLTVSWPGGAAPADLVDELIVRRWDSQGTLQVLTGGFINLEDGIQVGFADGDYRTGDYWLIPARTIRADVIWPLDPDTDEGEFVPRHGTIHHYAPLFLLRFDGGSFTDVRDLRRLFPPLTNIHASDVYFDNSDVCDLINADTVQEAIIALCQRDLNSCTFVVNSVEGWHRVFEAIDGSASVCFPVGDFRVDEPIIVRGKGNLKINGSGLGSRIHAPKSEAAFIFEDCESVTISDLYVEVGAAGSRGSSEHLNGALTFRNCGAVTVEEVTIKGAAGTSRAASCITVEQGESADVTGSVRIRHCDLAMGHQQTGILLLNVTRAQIEDNSLYVSAKPGRLSFAAMLRDPDYRGILRKMLISNMSVGPDAPPVPPGRPAPNVALTKNGQAIRFVASDNNLAGRWKTLVANLIVRENVNTPRQLIAFFDDVADNILLNEGIYDPDGQRLTVFKAWFDSLKLNNPAMAYQGISVAGRIAKDVRIQNNTIRGVLQGIHIGVSRRGPRGQVPERAENVIIASNTIGVSLPPEAAVRERHGIFVGNCASLLVADNYITVRRFGLAAAVRIDGIRVFGYLGRMMIVRQNHMVGFNVGIYVEPLGDISASQQWLVTDNMAVSAQQVVKVATRATAKVRVPNNLA